MELTDERKAYIDSLTYQGLLSKWRFAPIGDSWFQGETGDYWANRMAEMRKKNEDEHIRSSKAIGWER